MTRFQTCLLVVVTLTLYLGGLDYALDDAYSKQVERVNTTQTYLQSLDL